MQLIILIGIGDAQVYLCFLIPVSDVEVINIQLRLLYLAAGIEAVQDRDADADAVVEPVVAAVERGEGIDHRLVIGLGIIVCRVERKDGIALCFSFFQRKPADVDILFGEL